MPLTDLPAGVAVRLADIPAIETVLTTEALAFLAALHRSFDARRLELLTARTARAQRIDQGELPDFLPETQGVRDGDWKVAPIPADLLDRRVEITGPVDRKMIINALNSGAKVFMADCEDASTPTFRNLIEGQINLRDAVAGTIEFVDPSSGKEYKLSETPAVLKVRPRGWHLPEAHVLVDGKEMSGSLFDFGVFFFHNAKALLAKGSGPYFYLPKLESHLEARLWNDVFVFAQDHLGVPQGSIRATVLIETILATFEADEILSELRDHIDGLNCGRWDYIFSYIKKFRAHPDRILPDRAAVTMTVPFMRNYALHVIKTCHKRGAFAMGGMAAQIPIKNDPAANDAAMAKVRADKEREATDGHDGTWVAHPGLVPVAMEIFDRVMPGPNQLDRQRDDVSVTADVLLAAPEGPKTEAGLRQNIGVGIGYLEAWLRGLGCVPLHNLMEDAATAEISRAQVWQWRRHGVSLDDGRLVDSALIRQIIAEELATMKGALGEKASHYRHDEAAMLFGELCEAREIPDFLTNPAYRQLVEEGA